MIYMGNVEFRTAKSEIYLGNAGYDLSDWYAKSCVLIEDGYADLDFCDLPVEVPRHEALPQQLHTMHLGFHTASSVIPAQASPDGTSEIS